jgi:hypothetical protein
MFFEPQTGGSGDQSLDYKKIKPHFFDDMKDGAFCFKGLDLKP